MPRAQTAFGENYIQEAIEKQALLADLPLQWHCIGPIQSNKTRLVAAHFAWAHTVDRLKIAQRLSDQRPSELPPLAVCIQVNIDGGAGKSGVAPGERWPWRARSPALPRLHLRGLMTIPEPARRLRRAARRAPPGARLYEQLREAGLPLDTLSMGMTADLEAAIHAGSTMVRVGTAIFGNACNKTGIPASTPGLSREHTRSRLRRIVIYFFGGVSGLRCRSRP